MMNAVEVCGLSLSYGPADKVLDSISFSVKKGETLVVAGLSGCGKSSLCQALCGIIPQLIPAHISGKIKLMGENIANKSVAQLALIVALLFQDSDNQLLCTTVEDELAFGLENRGLPPESIAASIDRTLDRLSLTSYRRTDPGKLSGGEKKRTALGSVTATYQPIVIMDEPLSGLDQAGRDQVEELLRELQRAGTTILIVEHDLTAITAQLADRWLVLDGGNVVAWASPEHLRKEPLLRELELL